MSSVISCQSQIHNNFSNNNSNKVDKAFQTSRLFNNSFKQVTETSTKKKNILYSGDKSVLKNYDLVIAEIIQQSKLNKSNNLTGSNSKKPIYQTASITQANSNKNINKDVIPLEAGKGGKHKDVFFNKALACGYVVGKSKTAAQDAVREQEIEKYVKSINNPELSCRISTQKPITKEDIDNDPALKLMLSKSGIDPKRVAKFELKNKHGIEYKGFHDYIVKVRENKDLSIQQKTKIAKVLMDNFISTLYYMGVNKISNADLHGNNLKISFKSNNIFDPSQIEHLEVFDWGKSSNGDGFKFNQTLDFTLKEGDWMKQGQQFLSTKLFPTTGAFWIIGDYCRRMVFADIVSLVTGSTDLGYKEFKKGVFAKQADQVHTELNKINAKYANRDSSPIEMQRYRNAYLSTLTIFASFMNDRIDQLNAELPKKLKGGSHKNVYFTSVSGYVIMKGNDLSQFLREQAIEQYTKSLNNSQLSRRISTQKPITDEDIAKDLSLKRLLLEQGIDKSKVAKFELKNQHGVKYEYFHDYIVKIRENKTLSIQQKTKIAKALINHFTSTLYYMGSNKISNADLHGNNLKISFKSNNIFDPSQIEYLEVFDWGKSSNGDGFRFNETLDYILNEGDWMKKFQQFFSSSNKRSRRMVFADIMSLVTGGAASGYREFKQGAFAQQIKELYKQLNKISAEYQNEKYSLEQYQRQSLKSLLELSKLANIQISQLGSGLINKANSLFSIFNTGLTQIRERLFA